MGIGFLPKIFGSLYTGLITTHLRSLAYFVPKLSRCWARNSCWQEKHSKLEPTAFPDGLSEQFHHQSVLSIFPYRLWRMIHHDVSLIICFIYLCTTKDEGACTRHGYLTDDPVDLRRDYTAIRHSVHRHFRGQLRRLQKRARLIEQSRNGFDDFWSFCMTTLWYELRNGDWKNCLG